MYPYVAFSLAIAATSMAQVPTNLTFHQLTTQYLPFISINTAYILNDTRASQQLANAVDNPVTIFLSLNTPFQQYVNLGANPTYLTANWGHMPSFGAIKLPFLQKCLVTWVERRVSAAKGSSCSLDLSHFSGFYLKRATLTPKSAQV